MQWKGLGPPGRRRRAATLIGAGGVLALEMAAWAAAPGLRYETGVRPVLQKHCYGCHNARVRKADFDLSHFTTTASLARDPEVWRGVLAQLRARQMPPEGSPQPAEAERQRLIRWLEGTLAEWDARAPRNPGRVPLRRLNRGEYRRTIRDLLGLDLPLTDDFPADDTAYGFDNNAEGLTLSPLLLEKYLSAAERVLEQAIVTEGPLELLNQQWEGEGLPGVTAAGTAAELRLERELGTPVQVPRAGDYTVRVRAWQQGAGAEPATLVLRVDGVDTHVWSLNGEDRPTLLEATLPLGAGARRLSLRHTWHMSLPNGQTPPDARMFVDWVQVTGSAQVAAHTRLFGAQPGPKLPEREAARGVLHRFADRAYRRPVRAEELARLLSLFDRSRAAGKPYLEALRLPLLSVLVSPQFLFRIERGVPERDAAGTAALTDYELASRLSYFLWGSMPDEELFRLAGAKQLHLLPVLQAQVRRMLADPKSEALFESFAGQWLGLRKLEGAAPDPQLFPAFKPGLRQAMAGEAYGFFRTVAREDRSILELLDADWTLLNEELARHYGIPGVKGGYLRRVSLPDRTRGGVITMGAVLTVTSYPTRTSAVKRGKWVLEEILGAPPPPPPPNVPELEVPAKGQAPATTLRARLERHRADPRCSGCHARMDALGLGLENFDAVGRWREREGSSRIDPAGTLPGGETFGGPAELKQVLARHQEEFARNLVEKMLGYALGRAVQPYDRREVDRITAELSRRDWRFSTLISGVTESYPFRYRREATTADQPSRTR